MIKKLTVVVFAALAVAAMSGRVYASQTDTEDVDILVQPSVQVTLTASPTTYDFGVLDVGTSSYSATAVTLTNAGEVNVDIDVRVTDDGTWTLVDTESPDENQFSLRVGTGTERLTERTDFTALTTSDVALPGGSDVGTTQEIGTWYWIDMPGSVTSTDQQKFTLQYTATSR